MTNSVDPTKRVTPPPAITPGAFGTLLLLLPWLVFVITLILTYQLWSTAQQNSIRVQQNQFDELARNAVDDVIARMESYQQVMRGVDGLFNHASSVERSEFHDYIAKLQLQQSYPGIQAIRFVQLVKKTAKNRHIAAIHQEGFSAYSIWPEGQREFYTPVVYIEPRDARNRQIFGYDMYSDLEYPRPGDAGAGLRRAAMEQARDTGKPALSGKLRLIFETKQDEQAGSVLFLPIYKYGAPNDTLAERRANIVGWICSVFRMGDLMKGIFTGHADNASIDIDIYDGTEVSDKSLMYDPDHSSTSRDAKSHFQSHKTLEIAGHKWTMQVTSTDAFEAQIDRAKPRIIAGSGMAISLLLTLFTWLLVRDRARALQAAAAVARESRKNEILLRTASDGIYIYISKATWCRLTMHFAACWDIQSKKC